MTYRDHPITREPEALGVVGRWYDPFQNKDAFAFLSSVADESGAVFETAGSLHGGKRVFVSMKLPEAVLVGGVDPVDMYLLGHTSHDGSAAWGVTVTPIRVVCQNTLTAGLNLAIKRVAFRHTSSLTGRVQQAREALALSFQVSEAFQRQAEALISQEMTTGQYGSFVDAMMPVPDEATPRITDNVMNRRDELLALWNAPTQANIKGTRWAAYNAVVEWSDWARPVRGGTQARAIRTMTEVTDRIGMEMKQKALALLA
jgi:phage/plasmid-like protein (TIGR03299 family)